MRVEVSSCHLVLQIGISSIRGHYFCFSFTHSLRCLAQRFSGHVRVDLPEGHGVSQGRVAAAACLDHSASGARSVLPAGSVDLPAWLQGSSTRARATESHHAICVAGWRVMALRSIAFVHRGLLFCSIQSTGPSITGSMRDVRCAIPSTRATPRFCLMLRGTAALKQCLPPSGIHFSLLKCLCMWPSTTRLKVMTTMCTCCK